MPLLTFYGHFLLDEITSTSGVGFSTYYLGTRFINAKKKLKVLIINWVILQNGKGLCKRCKTLL